jgi:hypothetical protein
MYRTKYIWVVLVPVLLLAQDSSNIQTGSHNFVVYHSPTLERETVRRIVDQLESDYREFRYFFNLNAPGRTRVIFHNEHHSFHHAALASRFERGTVYNDEIHLTSVRYIQDTATLSSVITQQVIRLILYSRRMNGCPRWLYEGAAAYYAGIQNVQSPPVYTGVSRPSDLDELFAHPHTETEFYDGMYIAALSFESILERYGEAQAITLLRLFNGEFTYEQAVPYSLGVTHEQFESRWRPDVQRLLSRYRESYGR